MGHPMRKQYLKVAGHRILALTLQVFASCKWIGNIILVVPREDFAFCETEILLEMGDAEKVTLAPGGKERQASVYNGLLALKDTDGVVLIHDGVRPFIDHDLIKALITSAEADGACIPGIRACETLKKVNDSSFIEKTVNRDGIFFAQTPQAFRFHLIQKAHAAARTEGVSGTDDASLVERLGLPVRMISGSRQNIKITTKEDLRIAAALIREENSD